MIISILGLERGCADDGVVRCGEVKNANIIIDLAGSLKSLDSKAQLIIAVDPRPFTKVKRDVVDEIVVGGTRLRTLVGLGELEGEPVVRGARGEVFGVSVGGKIILYAKPLMLSLIHGREELINEVKIILNAAPPTVSIESAVNELVSLVISERRSRKVSRTLAYLEELLQDGDVSKVPPYILDVLSAVGAVTDGGVNRALLERIVGEVRARIYPRRG